MSGTAYRIVVGFDGSEGSKKALLWAASEARLRGATIEAVRAWSAGEFGSNQEQATINAEILAKEVHSVLGDGSGVQVSATAEMGRASSVLMTHARDADMLVVGSHGHGGFTGLLLGSVTQQLVTHAESSAVVVVRR